MSNDYRTADNRPKIRIMARTSGGHNSGVRRRPVVLLIEDNLTLLDLYALARPPTYSMGRSDIVQSS